jgi:hypothetical protein
MTSNIIAKEFDDALENYDREAMKILATFAKSLEAKEVPETIYHYTDDKGLKGILESGKIWVTDIFDLNDPSELLHGLSHAMDILKSKQINRYQTPNVLPPIFLTSAPSLGKLRIFLSFRSAQTEMSSVNGGLMLMTAADLHWDLMLAVWRPHLRKSMTLSTKSTQASQQAMMMKRSSNCINSLLKRCSIL